MLRGIEQFSTYINIKTKKKERVINTVPLIKIKKRKLSSFYNITYFITKHRKLFKPFIIINAFIIYNILFPKIKIRYNVIKTKTKTKIDKKLRYKISVYNIYSF